MIKIGVVILLAAIIAVLGCNTANAQEDNPYRLQLKIPVDASSQYDLGLLEGSRVQAAYSNIQRDKIWIAMAEEATKEHPDDPLKCYIYSHWLLRLAYDESYVFEPYNPRTALIEEKPEWPTDDEVRPSLERRIP